MKAQLAYVGIGTNLGDRARNLARAIAALRELGTIRRQSSLYRTAPWGRTNQPEFYNGVVGVQTRLSATRLVEALQAIEARLGRTAAERWGPRVVDLDLLLYGDERIDEERLRVPHEHMAERAFVLVPLAELDERFAPMRDALRASELAGVVRLDESENARFAAFLRENAATAMSSEPSGTIVERVRALANFLSDTDAVAVRIARGEEAIEIAARRHACAADRSSDRAPAQASPLRIETIKADLVGIFHHGRPAPAEGDVFEGDRELGYIEALGIRTPVHSLGAGRLVAIATADESPVEYGQPLFAIARA